MPPPPETHFQVWEGLEGLRTDCGPWTSRTAQRQDVAHRKQQNHSRGRRSGKGESGGEEGPEQATLRLRNAQSGEDT